MFRLRPAIQIPRAVLRPATQRACIAIRFESTKAPKTQAFKQAKATQLQDWATPTISYAELKPKTLSPEPNTYLIDVREPDEVAQGMIPSAVSIPLSTIGKAFSLDDAEFKKTYGFDKPKKNDEVIFYCRSGLRSSTAGDVAERHGYTNVLNYNGSWLEWTEKEVEAVEKQK